MTMGISTVSLLLSITGKWHFHNVSVFIVKHLKVQGNLPLADDPQSPHVTGAGLVLMESLLLFPNYLVQSCLQPLQDDAGENLSLCGQEHDSTAVATG